jgi:4-amino-4-deoxy-L-arabinose transferase-like glycosyltransferase
LLDTLRSRLVASPTLDAFTGTQRRAVVFGLIFVTGVVLRLALFSGYGLGDDPGYFLCYRDIIETGTFNATRAYNYRFSFWIPVVTFLWAFGINEAAWVGFVTLCSAANLVLVYLLARQEWGRRTGLLAMGLLAVLPLDVLSSTLFVIDIPLATYCFTAFWLYRESLARTGRQAIALALGASVFLFLGYSAKQWAVLVGLLFAAEGLRAVRRTWWQSLACGGGFLLLVALYYGWQWVRFGDPIWDIHVVRKIALFLPLDRDILLDYPQMLFLRNQYGTFFAGFFPHAVLVLAILLTVRTPAAGKWLAYTIILLVALAAAPSHRENGRWVVLVPHIFRYLCLLSIPLTLALAAYARELIRWRPAVGTALVAGFVVLSAWQGVALTAPTRDAFSEMRRASAMLRGFPNVRVASDYEFVTRFIAFDGGWRWNRAIWLKSESPEARGVEFRDLSDMVVVTGGARLPWYGCPRCTANIGELQPPSSWQLIGSIEGQPLTAYRQEPLRIWRVSQGAGDPSPGQVRG